jgi:hypothetical protein
VKYRKKLIPRAYQSREPKQDYKIYCSVFACRYNICQHYQIFMNFSSLAYYEMGVGTANCRPAKSAKDRVQFWAFALAMSEYKVTYLRYFTRMFK